MSMGKRFNTLYVYFAVSKGFSVQCSTKFKISPELLVPSSNLRMTETVGQGGVMLKGLCHKLTICCNLSTGEFGVVFKGRITVEGRTNETVAIKTLKGQYHFSIISSFFLLNFITARVYPENLAET